ncbi:hypothetical protein FG386_001368 [Cryptosporidium ryanae]|uniref:uncharacterized protein n=1 Tax=Cryptosporidium ryanae TaxID=515981 RepID=UPI00351AAEE5|nr:hypothetical protein FG386_001368 [Cryptosporidium ryanae]
MSEDAQVVVVGDESGNSVSNSNLGGGKINGHSLINNMNGGRMYMDQVINIPKINELGSSMIKDNLEFEPLKISLYELIMRQLIDDGLVEVAQLLHTKTRTSIPIHMQKNALYNLYKTVTYLPMDIRLGGNENNESNDLLELKSTNYVRRIESILPHLNNLTKKWIPIKARSRFLYLYRKHSIVNRICTGVSELSRSCNERGKTSSNNNSHVKEVKPENREKSSNLTREFYYLENLYKLKVLDSWNIIPNISAKLRSNGIISNHRPYCRALAVSPNGMFIATGGADGIVKIVPSPLSSSNSLPQTIAGSINLPGFGINSSLNVSSQQKTFTESKGIITALGYRVYKDVLISGDTDSSIIIYNIKEITSGANNIGDDENMYIRKNLSEVGTLNAKVMSRKPIQNINESCPINCIGIHPLDEHFYIGAKDPILRLYDINTLDCFTSLHPSHQHCSSINDIGVSQDGSIVFTCSDDGTIKIWDSVNLSCINTIYGAHNNRPVHSLSLSISQRYLLSSGGDGMARLWDLRQGKELVNYYTGLRYSCHSKVSFLLDERYTILTTVDGSNATYTIANKDNSSIFTDNCNNNTVNMSIGDDNSCSGNNNINDIGNCSSGDNFIGNNVNIKGVPNIELRINNKTRIFGSKVIRNNKQNKSSVILDHQINNKNNNIGDLLIYNTITGNIVNSIEGIHDAPVMNFELLYNSNVLSGLKYNNNDESRGENGDSFHNKRSDCSIITVSDDGKCRVIDLNNLHNI